MIYSQLFILIVLFLPLKLSAQYKGYDGYQGYSGYTGYAKPKQPEPEYVSTKTNPESNNKFSIEFNLPLPLNTTENIKSFITWEAKRMNVPVELALAIADAESKFRADAHSSTTAVGIYQFTEGTWRNTNIRMGRPQYTNLSYRYNPRLNIEAAMFLMNKMEYRHWFEWTGYKWEYIYTKYFGPYKNRR